MQRRNILLVLAVTTAIVVLALVAVRGGDREVSAAPPGERAVPGLAAKLGDLAWVRLSRGELRVNLALINGRWTVVEKGNYPANADRVRKLLLQLADLTLIEPKTDRPELLLRLDLDEPVNGRSASVTVQSRTGEVVGELIIGRRRPAGLGGGDDGVYVRRPGSDRAWLARGSFDLTGDLTSWLDRHIIDIPSPRIASIVLIPADGSTVILSRGSPAAAFAVEGAPDGMTLKPAAAAAPAAALTGLEFVDVRPAVEMPLAAGDTGTVAFTTFDGVIVGLRVSPPGQGDWVRITAAGFDTGETEAKALSDRLSHWSFAIPAEAAKLLRTSLADLVQPRGS
jgi:hypothetical protein